MGHSERESSVKIGDVVEGRYRILQQLGAGGMGTVFLAEHTLIKRRVAIKILHTDLATDADVIERFMNEARAAGTLGHPNIVESTDMGFTQNNVPYIVFEYLEGSLLTDEIYRVGGLPVRRALRIVEQVASALHAAHNANIVHRDLKTDNVFLTDKDDALDHVKVLDFGISRFLEVDDEATRRGMVMGTPEFMAPEQITSPDQVDRRADVYALGVMMYEMLSARRPFAGEDQATLLDKIVYQAAPALGVADVPSELEELICVRMLAKDPGARPQTMIDVLSALEPFIDPAERTAVRRRSQPVMTITDPGRYSGIIPSSASRDTPWPVQAMSQVSLTPPQGVPRNRQKLLYGLAAGGVMLGALGVLMSMRGGNGGDAQQPAPLAQQQPGPAKKVAVTFSSDAPGARVVFRRQNAAAPSTLEITPTDVVELVEVSAPGYKTERYWLTVDRPTKLNAHLEKGDGTAEASEDETLVALGEKAASPTAVVASADAIPAVHAPIGAAAIAPAAAAIAPAADHTSVTVPRKIGRAAAESQPVSKVDHLATPTTKSADAKPLTQLAVGELAAEQPPAVPEPPKAAPEVAAPTPAPVVAAVAVPEKAVAAPEQTAVPTPAAPEPPKADVASITKAPEPAIAKPAIDQATVSSVIGAHRVEVLKCLGAGKKADKAMAGTLTLQLQVDPSGRVRAQVQSTLGSPLVAACVVKAASSWKFPARAGDDFANVSYPFTIH